MDLKGRGMFSSETEKDDKKDLVRRTMEIRQVYYEYDLYTTYKQ